MTSQRARRAPQAKDRFAVWFFRLVQILGALLIVNEIVIREIVLQREDVRFVVIGTALALVTGSAGIEKLIQFIVDRR